MSSQNTDVNNPSSPESRILMVSSIGDGMAKKATAAGVDVFLTKPFGKRELVEAALSMLV